MAGLALLGGILFLGLVSRNGPVTYAAAGLILLKLFKLGPVTEGLARSGTPIGLILLIASLMAPLASERLSAREISGALRSPAVLTGVLGGAFASYLSGKGVIALERNPEIIVGLVIGSIMGTSFLGGVPVGPLVAAGFAAVFMDLIGLGP